MYSFGVFADGRWIRGRVVVRTTTEWGSERIKWRREVESGGSSGEDFEAVLLGGLD